MFEPYGYTIPSNLKIHIPSRLDDRFEERVLQKFHQPSRETIFTRSQYIAKRLAERGAPVLFESHAFSRDATKISMPKFIDAINTSSVSGIISISNEISAEYIGQGLNPKRILTLADAVNLTTFTRTDSGGLERLFGKIIYERPIMVYTGSLSKEKGAKFLTEASISLPEVNIAIIGGSPQESASLAKNYAKYSKNLFIHPSVPHKDIPSILHDASILVMPYLPEGTLIPYMSPLKLFEYLATGIPILSSELPVFSQILSNEDNCVLFDSGSIDSFCNRTKFLLEMSKEKKSTMRNSQIKTAMQFSWRNRAKTILDWHHAMLNGSNQP